MNFEIRGNKFFLTYPKCQVDKGTLLDQLNTKIQNLNRSIRNHVICTEKHQDGTDHQHVFLELNKHIQKSISVNWFNIGEHHPNIQTVRRPENVIAYIVKGADYITTYSNDKIEEFKDAALKKNKKKATKEDIGREIIEEKKELRELVPKYPWLIFGYSRTRQDIQCYRNDTADIKDCENTTGIWLHGRPRVGKSRIARNHMGGPIYFKDKSIWWDNYNNEPVVILEDVDKSWGEVCNFLKIWADRYVFIGQNKGGSVRLRPSKLIVTSNYTMEELLTEWNIREADWLAYTDRFSQRLITSYQEYIDEM